MGVRILFLEDDAGIRNWTAERLKECGYDVIGFSRVDQAEEYFCEHKNEIDCLIVDLIMNEQWLSKIQNESSGGFFTGLAWLESSVYIEKPNMPTIIYSAAVNLLDEWSNENNKTTLLQKCNIAYVDKKYGDNAGFGGLLKAIQKILSNIRDNDY